MENEELALRYQQGQTEVIGVLWDGVEKFVRSCAWRFAETLPPERGVTLDDLVQTGFLAVEEAARRYTPDGGAKFTTFLSYWLTAKFRVAAGYHTRQPDPLNNRRTVRLDAPLDEEDAEGDTIGDETPDARVDVDAAVVDGVYQEQLRAALDDALNELPAVERAVLERKYFRSEGRQEIAASLGLPNVSTVTDRERRGLERLRSGTRASKRLEAFLSDEVNPYIGTGLYSFLHSGASAVEIATERRDRLAKKWEKENA
jgi:RNA polymerase sigma factor (sigma-70 family)